MDYTVFHANELDWQDRDDGSGRRVARVIRPRDLQPPHVLPVDLRQRRMARAALVAADVIARRAEVGASLAMSVPTFTTRDVRAEALAGSARPLLSIMRQPDYFVALFGAATGGGVMVLAMTAGVAVPATVLQLNADVLSARIDL